MAQVPVDRVAALAVRAGLITRAQLEEVLREIGLRASVDRTRLVGRLVEKGFLTREQVVQLDKLLSRRDLFCRACHTVRVFDKYDPSETYVCPDCGGPLVRPDGLEATLRRRVDDIHRESGPITKETTVRLKQKIGRYVVTREIGRGSMGEVYLGVDERLDRLVAIKVLPQHLVKERDFVDRFRREARAMAKVSHPNVVQVHDVDEHEGRHFMVMEYVDGSNLEDIIRAAGRVEPRRAAKLILDATRGLQAVHKRGLVHRDVKPSNILVTKGGTAKVTDFGLVHNRDGSTTAMTLAGIIMGTPYYISPEAAQGKPTDARSDLYSLGVSFYYALCGRRPFDGGSAFAVVLMHIDRAAEPLPADTPRPLRMVIERMMDKEPKERPQSAAEVVDALKRYVTETART